MTPIEKERQRRIQVALWAYAYEFHDDPLVSDAKFDETCKLIDLSVSTGNPAMDLWFKDNFKNFTGQWIHNHPNLKRLEEIYQNLKGTQ